MRRRIVTALATAALALGGVVATSTGASAAEVPCPGSTMSAYNDAKNRGTVVDEYFVGRTGVVVYRIDNRYDAYLVAGMRVERVCHNAKPPRPAGATDTYQGGAGRENAGTGASSGGSGGSLGPGAWGGGTRTVYWSVTVRLQHH